MLICMWVRCGAPAGRSGDDELEAGQRAVVAVHLVLPRKSEWPDYSQKAAKLPESVQADSASTLGAK